MRRIVIVLLALIVAGLVFYLVGNWGGNLLNRAKPTAPVASAPEVVAPRQQETFRVLVYSVQKSAGEFIDPAKDVAFVSLPTDRVTPTSIISNDFRQDPEKIASVARRLILAPVTVGQPVDTRFLADVVPDTPTNLIALTLEEAQHAVASLIGGRGQVDLYSEVHSAAGSNGIKITRKLLLDNVTLVIDRKGETVTYGIRTEPGLRDFVEALRRRQNGTRLRAYPDGAADGSTNDMVCSGTTCVEYRPALSDDALIAPPPQGPLGLQPDLLIGRP